MRASIAIASHNEGERLWKTVQSCLETTQGLEHEVVVVDDASTDGCIGELERRYPRVRVIKHRKRLGVSVTKDAVARASKGDVIVFLDGHCKPEGNAIERLVADVEELKGKAVVAPRLPVLITEKWKASKRDEGFGFMMDLAAFDCEWLAKDDLNPCGRFYESPAFVGCVAAMSRELYEKLQGFDTGMIEWGVEDLDFSLKAWLMGHPILHDYEASVAHRFRGTFDNFHVGDDSVLVNKLRMARKNFTAPVFKEWLERCRRREPPKVMKKAWKLYLKGEESLEHERRYLQRHRVHDEFWYAEYFNLPWPERRPRRGQGKSRSRS
jgi:GT2 family glycosyltransferase